EGDDGAVISLQSKRVVVQADLSGGANVAATVSLVANQRVSGMGDALHVSGFLLEPHVAARIRSSGDDVIRPFLSGRDVMQDHRARFAIDFSGMSEEDALKANPAAYQHLIDHVKPERDQNKRKSIREMWWRFGWERPL